MQRDASLSDNYMGVIFPVVEECEEFFFPKTAPIADGIFFSHKNPKTRFFTSRLNPGKLMYIYDLLE